MLTQLVKTFRKPFFLHDAPLNLIVDYDSWLELLYVRLEAGVFWSLDGEHDREFWDYSAVYRVCVCRRPSIVTAQIS